MKKLKLIALASLALVAIITTNSCKKIKEAAQISIPLSTQEVEFTIPQVISPGTINIAEVNFPINVDSIIKANNADFAMKNIKSVSVNSCTLNLLDGDLNTNDNFSAISDASIIFKSNVNNTDVSLASISNNPDVPALSLVVPVNTSLDLANYFKTTSFSFKINATTRKATTKALQCKANLKFTLKVGL